MSEFEPLFKNPHLQTLAGHFWRRPAHHVRVEDHLYRTDKAVEVLVQSQVPSVPARGAVVLVHGMEGSGSSSYVRSLAGAVLRSGFAAHRFHMRSCGGTEHLSSSLYHGGQTSDLIAVLGALHKERPGPVFVVGFSLGGNVALKMAGELGEGAHNLIRGVCAVSAPIDLEASAKRLSEPGNRLYEMRFVRRMRSRLCASGRLGRSDFAALRSLREIDDNITAPDFGFGNAANYYRTQSAIAYLHRIRIPALLVQAKDDTFVPFDAFDSAAVRSNPMIEVIAPQHGGHLGFIGRKKERFWADGVIVRWISKHLAMELPLHSSR